MEDIITTNEALNDLFGRLRRLFSLKAVQADYKLTLNYKDGKLLDVEAWVWNRGGHPTDARQRFELTGKVSRKLKLVVKPSENHDKLEAEYTCAGCKVTIVLYLE